MTRGGYRAGSGRPKGSVQNIEHKDGRIVVACTQQEMEQIKKLAKEANKTTSRFIVDSILATTK